MDTMETVETCAAQKKKELKGELQTVFNTKEKMEPGGERKTSPQKTADPGQKRRKLLFYQKRQTIKRTNETSEKSDTSGIGFLKPEFEGPRVVGHTPYPQKVLLREIHCGQSTDKLEQYNAPLKDQTPASTSVTFTHRPPVITAALSQSHHTPQYLPSISNYSRFRHNLPVIDAAHSHRGLYHNSSGSLPLSTNYSTFPYNPPLLGSAHTHVAPGSSSTSSTPDFNSASIARSYPLSTSIATFSQPQQDVDLSAYKPVKKKRKRCLSHSQSSASSTSDSTVSHGVQSRPKLLPRSVSDALNRSLSRSDSYQNSFHGQETKQTKTEAAETAQTEEGLRPIQRFPVTEDVQNEQRSQKFSPEGNIGIFSNPIRPALIWPHNTQLLQQDRELKMFNQSACKLEGRRRAHNPPSLAGLHPSPTGLNTCYHYIQPQGYRGFEVYPSLERNLHTGKGSILPLSMESFPSHSCNVELRSPLSSFPGSSILNFNDPFQHLMLKEIKTEKINVPGSNEESDPEPNISHSRPSVTALPFCSQCSIPTVNGPPECSNEERLEEADIRFFVLQAEDAPDQNVTGAAPSPVRAEYESATNTPPPSSHLQVSSSCCLTRSHSAPSLSQTPKSNFRRAASLADMKLKEFTPAISAADGEDETYSFLCSCPGLYQCSVSGLVFSMKGEGDVVYRTVPWNRRLLAQHHKKPAGPLFDIQCLQQSVCQLHIPHCEIISTGGGRSLQVAHISDEGIEFISPHQVTETHVVLNISGFSAYGNVKDEDSPPDPVRALVLLFYKPPEDPVLRSVLSVLLLPRNIVIRDVQRTRRKLIGEERYLDTSPHCKLHPKQVYTLSTSPEDDLIKVQPKETEFDDEHHQSYFPSFQVVLKRILTDVNLTLRDSSSSSCVWEREVCLLPCGVKTLVTGPNRRPSDLRSSFVRRISGPVLSSLLDQLLDKRVITDAEREAADAEQSRRDRARLVFDTVSNKGEAARSEMMEFLCEEDPFLCEHLGLKAS